MPRLKRLSGADVRRILEKQGFLLVRQKGSHMILQKRTFGSTVTVPVPDHKDLKPGTLSSIIRQSHLDRAFFEE